ncbi:MAG: bifunctional methylenetetrahydrofolate dehydrogenase/methenyltetrahydrofolate cyclohydrolase FolD [Bacillota bacterium]|nr:bifunctional methylenetetrahydrofolate dehydrogenase/methenyltetrahydrofolate cyclohydrolase FolD [Bacillota bacterium]
MAAQILDGKALAARVRAEVAQGVAEFRRRKGLAPGLAVVLVGDDPASQIYVNRKEKACAEVGIYSETLRFPAEVEERELLSHIAELNARPEIHGILVQLPLPPHLEQARVLRAIHPAKDVDCFHPVNFGRLALGDPYLVPCTPAGILELIRQTGVPLAGREAVVVGRSNIVGKPTALLLLGEHATVTVCHSRTADLPAVCRRADVLVVAVGRREMVKGHWIKPGAVVIDVGINRYEGKLYGDVDFRQAVEVAGYLTPVPGGVGPMTIAMLLRNTLRAAEAGAP